MTNVFWNAQSWVGLSGGFGELRGGRQFVPAFQIGIAVDAPGGRVGRNEGANVQYSQGPPWVGLGYNNARQEGAPTRNRFTNLGIAYDLGFVRPLLPAPSATTTSPARRTSLPDDGPRSRYQAHLLTQPLAAIRGASFGAN